MLGDVEDGGWEQTARQAITRRIEAQGREIRFSLMGVVKDQRVVLKERLDIHTERAARLQSLGISSSGGSGSGAPIAPSDEAGFEALMELGAEEEKNKEKLVAQLQFEEAQQMDVEARLKQEEAKHERWKVENVRRKHNYVPLAIKLIDRLAAAGRLQPMIQKAKDKSEADRQAAAASKQKQQQQT